MNETSPAAGSPAVQRIFRSLPSVLRAVIFDKDGLLLDTEPLEFEAAQTACARLGFVLRWEDYLAFIGHPRDANDIRLKYLFGTSFPLDAYHYERMAIRAKLSTAALNTKPGARELVATCKLLKIKVGLATSSKRDRTVADLRAARLLDQFDAIICRDDVVRGKPDPESYRLAVERLEIESSACLALEDSRSGVASARSAGLSTIMVPDLLPDDGCAAEFDAVLATSLWEVHWAFLALTDNRP